MKHNEFEHQSEFLISNSWRQPGVENPSASKQSRIGG